MIGKSAETIGNNWVLRVVHSPGTTMEGQTIMVDGGAPVLCATPRTLGAGVGKRGERRWQERREALARKGPQ